MIQRFRPTSARLGPLAAVAGVDPDRARDVARRILSDDRYGVEDPPRPLEAIGEAIARLFGPVQRFFERVAHAIPGGSSALWLILAVVVVVAAVAIAIRMTRWMPETAGMEVSVAGGGDPDALERAAEEARAAGDYRNEIRYRFQAGLIRLGRAGQVRGVSSLTSGEAARAFRSETFNQLARSFDEVVYGGRGSTPEDAELSRSGWRELLSGRTR